MGNGPMEPAATLLIVSYTLGAAFAFAFAILIVHGRELAKLRRLNYRLWLDVQALKGNGVGGAEDEPPPVCDVCADADFSPCCSECSVACSSDCCCWCHGLKEVEA